MLRRARTAELNLARPPAEPLRCRYRAPFLYDRQTLERALERAGAEGQTYADTQLILIQNDEEGTESRDQAHLTAVAEWQKRTLEAERRLFNYSEVERIEHRCSPGYSGPRLGMTTEQLAEAWTAEREGPMPRHWLVQSESIEDQAAKAALHDENIKRAELKTAIAHYQDAQSRSLSEQELRKRLRQAREARWALHEANQRSELLLKTNGIEIPPHEAIDDPPEPETAPEMPQKAMTLDTGTAPPKAEPRVRPPARPPKKTEGQPISMFG